MTMVLISCFRSPIGEDITEELTKLGLKIPRLKLEIQP